MPGIGSIRFHAQAISAGHLKSGRIMHHRLMHLLEVGCLFCNAFRHTGSMTLSTALSFPFVDFRQVSRGFLREVP